jgi:septal ring factor EnvC (AmiA/AmiB activator)
VASESDTANHSIKLIEDHYAQNQFQGLNIVYYKEDKSIPHHPLQTKLTLDLIRLYAKNNLYNSKPQNKKTIINEEKYVKKLEKELNKTKKELNKTKKEFNKAKKENKNLKNIKREMQNSKSWKITRPLRKLMNMLKRK